MATRTLLCIDPDRDAVDLMSGALEPYGFEVKNITNGGHAIEWGRKHPPAVIVLSVEPKKVGYALCSQIRRSAELKDIPIILTASEETQQTFEQHKKLKARADEYMLKPLHADELLSKIDRLVQLGKPQDGQGSADDVLVTAETGEISIEEDIEIVETWARKSEGDTGPIEAHPPNAKDEASAAQPPGGAAWGAVAETQEAAVPTAPDEVMHTGSLGDVSTPIFPAAGDGAAEMQLRIQELEDEQRELNTVIDELRSRLQAQPISKEKDILSLREVINRKDKDLLDLRDALDGKERQILDHKDRVREHERVRRDLEEQMLGVEKNLVAANERVAALVQDKEKVLEREKSQKRRLDDALTEIQKAHQEADGLKQKLAAAEELRQRELAEAERRHLAEQTDLGERHRADLGELLDRATRAEGELTGKTDELAEALRKLGALDLEIDGVRADLREHAGRLGQARDRIAELEQRVGDYEDQILRAYQKLRADEKTVDKAKRALAVALSLLDTASAGQTQAAAGAPRSSSGEAPT